MQTTIDFSIWGNRRGYDLPKRAYFKDGDSRIDALVRAIERKTKLEVANCRKDCWQEDRDGRVISQHYELTLGKRAKGGGYNIDGSLWVAIKTPTTAA